MPTIYKTRGNTTTVTRMTVDEITESIRNKKFMKEVAEFRSMVALDRWKHREDGSLDIDAKWEKDLPRLCFATDYVKRSGAVQMQEYNGLVLLEVSNLADGSEASDLRKLASLQPQTLLTFVGADSRSVIIVCKAEKLPSSGAGLNLGAAELNHLNQSNPSAAGLNLGAAELNHSNHSNPSVAVLTPEELKVLHYNAYAMAQKFYTAQLQTTVDVLEPHLDRICYMSADAEAYYNPLATPFYASAEKEKTFGLPVYHEKDSKDAIDEYSRYMKAEQYCLAKAYEQALAAENEDEYIFQVLNLHARYCMESGIPMALAQRLTLYTHDFHERAELVAQVFDNTYTPKAMRRLVNANPELLSQKHIPDSTLLMMKTKVFMKQNYEFRKNVLSGVAQYRLVEFPYFEFRDVTLDDRNSMTIRAQEKGLKSWDKDIKRYIESNEIPQYDPIDDYLTHLPKWDGKDRLAAFTRRVPTKDPFWQRFFPVWMRSMVAHWMGKDQQHGNALVPLLIGRQGCGKSTFCGIVLPPELSAYYNDRVSFKNEFDLLNQLSSFALINIDEFDSIGNSRQPLLKYLLSKPNVKLRVPYGKVISHRRRYASFIATTNKMQPLVDMTGSRRFLCVNVDGVIDTTSRIDYPQLYAQLLAEIMDGQRYWLNDDETQELIAHNQPFHQLDSLEEMVRSLFRKPEEGDAAVTLPVWEIVTMLQKCYNGVLSSRATSIQVGKILKGLGFQACRAKGGNSYVVVVKNKV